MMNTKHKNWHLPVVKGFLAPIFITLIATVLVCFVNKWNWEPIRKLSRRSVNSEDQFDDLRSQPDQQHDTLTDQIIHLKLVRTHTAREPYQPLRARRRVHPHAQENVYEWVAWGRVWALRVWSDANFIAPTFLVREERTHDSWVGLPHDHSQCFARGQLEGHKESDAALNTCGGLSGVLRVGEHVYTIQPLSYAGEEDSQTSVRRPNGPRTHPSSGSFNTSPEHPSDSAFKESGNSEERRFAHSNSDSSADGSEQDSTMRSRSSEGSQSGGRVQRDSPFSEVLGHPHLLRLVSAQSLREHQDPRDTEGPTREEDQQHRDVANISVSQIGSSYMTRENDVVVTSGRSVFMDYLRHKRFIFSKRHTIEVMVVVDYKMAHYHGKHVEKYVLTLMSMVSLLFRDSSIGNNLDIAVVEVVKPEGKSFAPKKAYQNYATSKGESAEEMLKMFCKWQKQGLKYNEDHPHKYDTALLITRENICRNPYTQRCDTLGLAELGTMCSRYASCAIVQDNGLSAAFTIAHELGHLLNMPHDNDDKCTPFRGTEKESPKHMNVMSRMLDHNTLPWIWSNCSRYYLSEYFQAGLGECLEDEPWNNDIVEDDLEFTLSGEKFGATQQCQYVFGKSSSICTYMPKCKRLWCTTTLDEKEGCRTQHMPWADGTPCEKDMWCLRGECIPKNKAERLKVDGQWGAWQRWGACSRTCGVGVRRSERFCDSPKPMYGGHFCVGERVRYESCKLTECPVGSIDFRSQQCEQFNGKNFGLPNIPDDVKWIPKYADRREDSCKLFCQAHNSGHSYQLKEKVEDGTPCGPGTYDICVSGKCRVAGCDYVLNSTLEDDWCGICNGDNSTCEVVMGSEEDVQIWGYSDILVIPEGAARIEILQKSHHHTPADDNYLALADYETGEYLLNGNWVVTPFEKFVEFGGSLLEYTGSNQVTERINSTKPLKRKLLVQILSVGQLYPPNVHYSYSQSIQDKDPDYLWQLSEWTECSRPCIGQSERIPFCIRADTQARVADVYCNEDNKPFEEQRSCAVSCQVQWSYSEWGSCSLDASKRCVKQREVQNCVTSEEVPVAVEVERCAEQTPVTEMDCEKEECPIWHYSGWTPCSCPTNKYTGQKKRLYACYMRNRPVNDWECRSLKRPLENKTCPCWHVADWGPCIEEDDRTALEFRGREEELSKPIKGRSSKLAFDRRAYKSPTAQTTSFEPLWNGITTAGVSCQRGKKRRRVTCGSPFEKSPPHLCDLSHKPSEVSLCQMPCTATTPFWPREGLGTKGGFIKGERKEKELFPGVNSRGTRNEITKSPLNHHNELSNQVITRDRYDSGEEEHNNLVNGHQNIDKYLWQTGGWTRCSKDCGGGERRRQVSCMGDRRLCPLHSRPAEREPCNMHPCTEWTHHEWSRCKASRRNPCRGRKERKVFCRDQSGRAVNPTQCLDEDRPTSRATCRLPCDKKKRRRNRYKWLKGPWTSCSSRCGLGIQTRYVTCHKVTALGWVDPDPMEGACRRKEALINRRECNMGSCLDSFFWATLPWKPCQGPCGSKGRQRRSVICVDSLGVRVQRNKCRRTLRPRRKQRCRAQPCGHRNCPEVRVALGVYLDGEYSLLVGGVNMSIFCFGMNTTDPKEYLTLPAGEEGNYAEIYNKRLLLPDTCPYNGERRRSCHCVDDESGRAGLTTFSKIRINTTSLAVNTYDFTFARMVSGRMIAYGEAGDCYSMTQCPQGSFSINLAGTLLKVSDRTTWRGHGNKAVHRINRLDESQRILGRCGGYCGTCTPDPHLGLKLDVRMTTRRYT